MEQMNLFDMYYEEEVKPTGKKTVLLVDGNNLLNRCFYATARDLNNLRKSPDGRLVNGVAGFLRSLLNYRQSLKATHIGVTFDKGRGFRGLLYPAYKGGRKEQPEQLKVQFPLLEEVLTRMGITLFSSTEYEADDLIGSFATQLKEDNVFLLSNDKDLHQLVTDTCIQIVRKGSLDVFLDRELFMQQYEGLEPKQIVDLKSIAGDSSDNIIGIPGIGDKGAMNLVSHFRSVQNMVESEFPKTLKKYQEKVQQYKEEVLLANKLTTLEKDVPVQNSELTSVLDVQETLLVFKELGLFNMVEDYKKGKIVI